MFKKQTNKHFTHQGRLSCPTKKALPKAACVETHVWLVAPVPALVTRTDTHNFVLSRDLGTPVFGDFREDEQPCLVLLHLRVYWS